MNELKIIIAKWRNRELSQVDAFYELTGLTYAVDNARKGMSALAAYLKNYDNLKEFKPFKLEQETIITTNKNGEQIKTHASTMVSDLSAIRDKTPSEIVFFHGYDPTQWQLKNHIFKAWNGTSKLQGTYTLYSSTVKIEPLQDKLTENQLIEVFNGLKLPKIENKIYEVGDKLLEIPIMDLHLGKLAWDKEVGFDYDLQIAEKLYKDCVLDIISKVKQYGFKIEKIMFPIGQDIFNSDNDKSETNKGTSQDMDSRWQKMYSKGCQIVVWAIEQLRDIAEVEVMYIPGNHSSTLSYFLIVNTASWYKDCSNVKVDVSPRARKYIQYYDNMIGYTHGEESKAQLDKLMQSEAPVIWGNTKHREFHLGHLHTERVTEYPGFKQRRISSITSPDAWHYSKGYTEVIRQAQAFIWDRHKGLEVIINSIVEIKKED